MGMPQTSLRSREANRVRSGAQGRMLPYAKLPVDGFPASRLVLATRLTSRLRGLLMSPESDSVLMLAPCRDIHTFGMGYAIDVAFVDEHGRIIQSCRDVLPNRRVRNAQAVAVLERFAVPREVWFEEGECLELGGFRAADAPAHSRKDER